MHLVPVPVHPFNIPLIITENQFSVCNFNVLLVHLLQVRAKIFSFLVPTFPLVN